MRLINFAVAKTVRVGVEDGNDIVDLIDALGGERRVKKEDRAVLADTVPWSPPGRRECASRGGPCVKAAKPGGGARPNAG